MKKVVIFILGFMLGSCSIMWMSNSTIKDLRTQNIALEQQLAEARGMLDSTIGHMEMAKDSLRYGDNRYDKP